jgi:hypothetical protein
MFPDPDWQPALLAVGAFLLVMLVMVGAYLGVLNLLG